MPPSGDSVQHPRAEGVVSRAAAEPLDDIRERHPRRGDRAMSTLRLRVPVPDDASAVARLAGQLGYATGVEIMRDRIERSSRRPASSSGWPKMQTAPSWRWIHAGEVELLESGPGLRDLRPRGGRNIPRAGRRTDARGGRRALGCGSRHVEGDRAEQCRARWLRIRSTCGSGTSGPRPNTCIASRFARRADAACRSKRTPTGRGCAARAPSSAKRWTRSSTAFAPASPRRTSTTSRRPSSPAGARVPPRPSFTASPAPCSSASTTRSCMACPDRGAWNGATS